MSPTNYLWQKRLSQKNSAIEISELLALMDFNRLISKQNVPRVVYFVYCYEP